MTATPPAASATIPVVEESSSTVAPRISASRGRGSAREDDRVLRAVVGEVLLARDLGDRDGHGRAGADRRRLAERDVHRRLLLGLRLGDRLGQRDVLAATLDANRDLD